MKTKRAPWDYQRPVIIVSQKIKLCQLCGGHVFYMPNEVYRCIDCRTVGKFDEIEEADAAFYRDCLAKKQEDDAVLLALSMLPQMAFVQDAINMVADITPETETEMNSWIEENDAWLASEPVAVQQAAVYMEAAPPHSHLPVKVLPYARWFRHGGVHPLSGELTAYTWCSGCGEILSLDNDEARKAMPDF